MDINSQFLYSYIDELIKSQWIDWSERLLSNVPPEEFHIQRGFQKLAGADNSFTRTRALECFRLGLINSRVITERTGSRSQIPEGWRRVCEGMTVHTRLGYFAYIIGKALEAHADDNSLNLSVDAIAAIQILLIGFKYDGRWYSTVNIFDHTRIEYEKVLGRALNDKEIRYLSGAVFNTLDGHDPKALIESYKGKGPIPALLLTIRDTSNKVILTPETMEGLIADPKFNINSIDKHKGALFWSSERGIYSRASSSSGRNFLTSFMEIDRSLAAKTKIGIINSVFESINEGNLAKDLIDTLSGFAKEYPILLEQWEKIMSRLEKGVVKSLEYFDAGENKHKFLTTALDGIRETLEEDYEVVEDEEIVKIIPSEPEIKKQKSTLKKKLDKKTLSPDEIKKFIPQNLSELFVSPPKRTKVNQESTNKRRIIRKFDTAARDAKNRELGFIGEEFVVEVEKRKLQNLGYSELSEQVKWISKHLGDGAGYDIASYDVDKTPIFIEVKATRGSVLTQFYLSENELVVSKEKGTSYRLYRVFDIDKAPKIYILKGALDATLDLKPTNYRAQVKNTDD